MNKHNISLQQRLAALPSVNTLLQTQAGQDLCARYARSQVVDAIREALDDARTAITAQPDTEVADACGNPETLLEAVTERLRTPATIRVRPAINASGILFHDALITPPLSEAARAAMTTALGTAISDRTDVEQRLCRITGAEAALLTITPIVALWLAIDTLAHGKTVVISRGQLGAMDDQTRLLDILSRCHAGVIEVGATNKTHLRDYAAVLNDDTGVICVVRPANYAMRGFTQEAPVDELVRLGAQAHVPVVYAIGHAALASVQSSGWRPPLSLRDAAQAGVAVTIAGGDGLIGGPACGVAVGRLDAIVRMRANPLAALLAPGVPTIVGMDATLDGYDPSAGLGHHPAGWMMTDPVGTVAARASRLLDLCRNECADLGAFEAVDTIAHLTAARLPDEAFPSRGISIRATRIDAAALADLLRGQSPAVLCASSTDRMLLDLRAVADRDIDTLFRMLRAILKNACVTT